jgi:hypothetical protein
VQRHLTAFTLAHNILLYNIFTPKGKKWKKGIFIPAIPEHPTNAEIA